MKVVLLGALWKPNEISDILLTGFFINGTVGTVQLVLFSARLTWSLYTQFRQRVVKRKVEVTCHPETGDEVPEGGYRYSYIESECRVGFK